MNREALLPEDAVQMACRATQETKRTPMNLTM